MTAQEVYVETVNVKRWPTEKPLFILVVLCAIAFWILFAVSIVGILYAAMLGAFFFVSHIVFIAHLRGSAVRLGPAQMPELYERVQQLSRRVGLKKPPETYVMQAGGALNALATKLFSSDFIVLYSDLLDACGDNTEARDMIIAHELGHLKAGHLRGWWFLFPGLLVPFLGGAYSRAREFTSDRYGFALCRDRQSALIGMGILAAGGKLGPSVNLRQLAEQGNDLNTVWMTLGRWLSSHPPLVDRIVAVEPSLITRRQTRLRGTMGAVALILCVFVVPVLIAVSAGSKVMSAIQQAKMMSQASTGDMIAEPSRLAPEEISEASQQALQDMQALSTVIEEYRAQTGQLPFNSDEIYAIWRFLRPDSAPPVDPFDGYLYGYESTDDSYTLWSEGPSSQAQDDDIVFTPESRSL